MTADELITQVRNLAQVPDTDEDITPEFILTQAYLGLLERFTQPIVTLRNGTWLHSHTFTTTSGISRYRLPARSIVQGLEKVECAMGQGASQANSSQWYLLNVQTNIQSTDYEGLAYNGRPAAFTYQADNLIIYPTPSSSWTIRVWYYLRPSQLSQIADFEGEVIIGVTSLGGGEYDVTLGSELFNDLGGTRLFDLQYTTGNNEMLAVDVPAYYDGVPDHLNMTLTDDQAALLTAHSTSQSPNYDVVCMRRAEPTPAIQLPEELANALVSYVGAVVLAEKGDSEKAQVFSQKCELSIKNITDLALPRSKGQPSVFRTRHTYLRRRLYRGGWVGRW